MKVVFTGRDKKYAPKGLKVYIGHEVMWKPEKVDEELTTVTNDIPEHVAEYICKGTPAYSIFKQKKNEKNDECKVIGVTDDTELQYLNSLSRSDINSILKDEYGIEDPEKEFKNKKEAIEFITGQDD